MGIPVGEVTIEVFPDADQFQEMLRKQLPFAAMERMAKKLGDDLSSTMGKTTGRASAAAATASAKATGEATRKAAVKEATATNAAVAKVTAAGARTAAAKAQAAGEAGGFLPAKRFSDLRVRSMQDQIASEMKAFEKAQETAAKSNVRAVQAAERQLVTAQNAIVKAREAAGRKAAALRAAEARKDTSLFPTVSAADKVRLRSTSVQIQEGMRAANRARAEGARAEAAAVREAALVVERAEAAAAREAAADRAHRRRLEVAQIAADGRVRVAEIREAARKERAAAIEARRLAAQGGALQGLGSAAALALPQRGTGALSGMVSMMPNLAKWAGPVAAVGVSLYGVAQAAQVAARGIQMYASFAADAFSKAGELEQTIVAMETMFDSQAKAADVMEKAIGFAMETPFRLPDVTMGIRQLKAYGFAGKDLIPVMRDIGDATAALGLGADGIDRMIRAFGQIKARGAFAADEARQLTEAGIPAWRALAEALSEARGEHVSVQDVMKLTEDRAIGAAFAIDAIREAMQESFGGGMERQAKTLLGTVAKIQDAMQIGLQTRLQTSIPAVSSALQQLLDPLTDFSQAVGSSLGAGMEGLVNTLMPRLQEMLPQLQDVATTFFAEIGPAIGDLTAALVELATEVGPALVTFATHTATTTADAASSVGDVLDNIWPDNPILSELMRGSIGLLFPPLAQLLPDPQEMASSSEASIASVKAFSRVYASMIDEVASRAGLRELGLNLDALEAADPDQIKTLLGLSDTVLISIGIEDPAAMRTKLEGMVGAAQAAVGSTLITPGLANTIGEVERRLEGWRFQIATLSKEQKEKFGIEPRPLGDLSKAGPQLRDLLALDNKQLSVALDLKGDDEVERARSRMQDILRLMKQIDTTEAQPALDLKKVNRQGATLLALVKKWMHHPDMALTLHKAGISPAALKNFESDSIADLAALKPKQLVELGIKRENIPAFRKQITQMLDGLSGRLPPVDVQFTAGGQSIDTLVEAILGGQRRMIKLTRAAEREITAPELAMSPSLIRKRFEEEPELSAAAEVKVAADTEPAEADVNAWRVRIEGADPVKVKVEAMTPNVDALTGLSAGRGGGSRIQPNHSVRRRVERNQPQPTPRVIAPRTPGLGGPQAALGIPITVNPAADHDEAKLARLVAREFAWQVGGVP